nr:DNA ligase [Darna trima granulovirus]
MLFSTFVDVYENIMASSVINDIALIVNKNVPPQHRNEMYLWLYLISTFEKKFKINDKHLLTVFCKIQEPHIDRKNLQEAFRSQGVAKSCSDVVKAKQNSPSLTMTDVYAFLQKLQTVPSKSFYLLKQFRTVLPYCNDKTLSCLIDLIRNSSKNKKLIIKKRNLYLFKQVFGKKNSIDTEQHHSSANSKSAIKRPVTEYIKPGKPIECMLAQPCKSLNFIPFKEMCVEIKYNGERLQLHKFNDKISCYKRNLNESLKCNELMPVIARVLNHVNNVILDCELIGLYPSMYQLIVFDVLYYNEQCLLNEKLSLRKKVLREVMCHQEYRMMEINYETSSDKTAVDRWIKTILKLDCLREEDEVEGVVIKNWNGNYEPKRKKWFKIKRSYFKNVCSADLVVVGGWNSEKKNGRITIYLVATPFYDYELNRWMFLPVSKVKYSKNNYKHWMVPYDESTCDWLVVDDYLKSLKKVPDLVAANPTEMPVWELEGDFIRNDNVWVWGSVTRNYVSIRLPRFVQVRRDKTFRNANTVFDLQLLSSITNKSFLYPELYDFYISDNIKNYTPNCYLAYFI